MPLPALSPGDALFGPAVGEVAAVPEGSPLRPSDTVTHLQGWRDHAVVDAAACTPVGDVLPDPVAHLAQGSSAYGALTRLAGVRAGDTVLVTGAAGAVSTLARRAFGNRADFRDRAAFGNRAGADPPPYEPVPVTHRSPAAPPAPATP